MPFTSNALSPDSDMNTVVPVDPKVAYDVREIVTRVVDYQDFLEVQPGFAPNIVVGFGRLQGRPVGIIANQPACWPACWTSTRPTRQRASSASATPSIFRCSRSSMCRASCRACSRSTAASSATAPRCCSPTRRPRFRRSRWSCARPTAAHTSPCARKDLGADRVFAWPTAEIAVMGAEGAAEIVFRREIEAATRPGRAPQGTGRRVSRDIRQSVRRGRAPAGGRHHRAGRDAQAPGAGARISARQARTAPAEEARTDSAMRKGHRDTALAGSGVGGGNCDCRVRGELSSSARQDAAHYGGKSARHGAPAGRADRSHHEEDRCSAGSRFGDGCSCGE